MQRTFCAQCTQLPDVSPNALTKSDILRLHKEKVAAGENFTVSTVEIVDALGGIDQVLQVILSSDQTNVHLCNLQRLKLLLKTPQSNVKPCLTYSFDADQIWHCVNPKIVHFVYHKWTLFSAVVLLFLALCFSTVMHNVSDNIGYVFDMLFNCCFAIPYGIAFILALNPDAFKIVFKSFDFRIKLMLRSLCDALFIINVFNQSLSLKISQFCNALGHHAMRIPDEDCSSGPKIEIRHDCRRCPKYNCVHNCGTVYRSHWIIRCHSENQQIIENWIQHWSSDVYDIRDFTISIFRTAAR